MPNIGSSSILDMRATIMPGNHKRGQQERTHKANAELESIDHDSH